MRSYTSSAIASTSYSWHSPAISSSSARVKTLPVGLCGVLIRMSLGRWANAARSSSGSKRQELGDARWELGLFVPSPSSRLPSPICGGGGVEYTGAVAGMVTTGGGASEASDE